MMSVIENWRKCGKSISKIAAIAMFVGLPLMTGCHRNDDGDAASGMDQIQIATANPKLVTRQIAVTGVLQAEQRTDLAANSTGRVTQVFVEIGQRVQAGAPLAQLDSRMAAMSAKAARANAASAGSQYSTSARDCARYGALLGKGAITRQEYDRAVGQCGANAGAAAAAAANAQQASESVSDATIRAPFAGIVTDKMIHVGDFVRPESPVVTLLSDGQLRLRLTVPEPELRAAREGAIVTFETVGMPGKQFRANLKFISREVRQQTRDLIVEAIVENEAGALLPGMFVTAHLASGEITLPVVPSNAVIVTETGPRVMVAVGDRFEERVVQTGAFLGNGEVAITDGLKAGERVVVRSPVANAGIGTVAMN